MDIRRKPFQGVLNIIRFNWHFFLIAGIVLTLLGVFISIYPEYVGSAAIVILLIPTLAIVVSLLVSYYVYDLSGLYQLKWLPDSDFKKVLNINAGFDETSGIIKSRFPNSDLSVCDFYNKEKHTEVSIRRARIAYPPYPGTSQVSACKLPFDDGAFDYVFAILSAHEIRDDAERVMFFKELNRITKSSGQIFVTEHLRDFNNFIAYSLGFFHFHTRTTWEHTFKSADLVIDNEMKITPFITTFTLRNNGNAL